MPASIAATCPSDPEQIVRHRARRRPAWHRLLALGACAVMGVMFLAGPATGEEETFGESPDAVKEGRELVRQSAQDWDAKKYGDAAVKLRKAIALLEPFRDVKAAERADVLRRLIWNEAYAGNDAEVLPVLARVLQTIGGHADLAHEAANTWGAIWHVATRLEGAADVSAFLGEARTAYLDQGHDSQAAQCAHSLAWRLKELGAHEDAVEQLRLAIAERRILDDIEGLAWSFRNLGMIQALHLKAPRTGLPALAEAHALVHREYATLCQSELADTIRETIRVLRTDKAAWGHKDVGAWLETLFTQAATSDAGEALSLGWLGRQRLAWATAKGTRELEKTAKALGEVDLRRQPAAVRADWILRAAEALLAEGTGSAKTRARKADDLLASLPEADGPAWPHLRARQAVLRTMASAAGGTDKAFLMRGTSAIEALNDLGDDHLRRWGLEALAKATTSRDPEAPIEAWVQAWEALRRKGKPGGAGGSATSSGDRSKFRNLSQDAEAFFVTVSEERVKVNDLPAQAQNGVPLRWTPSPLNVNGLGLRILGGYVAVASLNYGNASSSGMPGSMSLDDLGDYWPLPAAGGLIVQKNGAIRYRAR